MRLRSAAVLVSVALIVAGGSIRGQTADAGPSSAQDSPPSFRGQLADYDAEPRLANGRVDVDRLIARLKELSVSTYYWLVWHAASDWDDLKLFLPKAAAARINVWVYLVPPTESPPHTAMYAEPFRGDYQRWAEEIGRLSLQHANLTGWVIDDFYANHGFFTPDYVRQMQSRAKQVNSRLVFLPLMYFGEITPDFVQQYRGVIDGVVVAYPRDRREIDCAEAILRGATIIPGQLYCPWNTRSAAGDFAAATVTAQVTAGAPPIVRFRDRDDFRGATAGYHFKQLLVDGTVAWEEDVAGGDAAWHEQTVNIARWVRGKAEVSLTFRLLDRKGVSNFGVRWDLADLRTEGLRPAADLNEPRRWQASQRGVLKAGFGPLTQATPLHDRIPYILMTAADASEFRMRHGDPASPERIAQWLEMCLQTQREGKCDGVVTYCLNKGRQSAAFPLAAKAFHEHSTRRQ